MAVITAALVNELRKKTNVGMMECKKALNACDGDMTKAVEWLRKSGMAKAEEKAGRAAKNGIVAAKIDGNTGAMVEFLCETDFAAKTDAFKNFGAKLAEEALKMDGNGDIAEAFIAATKEEVKAQVGVVKENMMVRRAIRWVAQNGKIAYYIHTAQPYAAMVELEGDCSDEIANLICMHIAAFRPEFITRKDVPADRIAKELEIALAQVEADEKTKTKPQNVKQGIAQGKVNKWYATVCLMEQPWIMDNKTSLEKLAPGVTVKRMALWLVGEELPGDNA